MNWSAQLRHIAAKDVRHIWFPLAVYVSLAAASVFGVVTGSAFGPYQLTPSTEVLGMRDTFVQWIPLVMVMLGLVAAASLVQADSPTRPNAFWASRPLAPTAVLGAKFFLMAILAVGLPIPAGIVALRVLHADPGIIAAAIARACLSYVELTLAVMIIGALTDDWRAFVATFVVVMVVTIVALAIHEAFFHTQRITPLVLTLVSVPAAIVFLAIVYRTRDRRRLAWFAGVIATMGLVSASFASPFDRRGMLPAIDNTATIQVKPADRDQYMPSAGPAISLRIVGLSDSSRLFFEADRLVVQLTDGKTITSFRNGLPRIERDVLPPLGPDIHWLGDAPREPTSQFSVESREMTRESFSGAVMSLSVSGIMRVLRTRIVGSLPLQDGAVLVHDGWRFRIYGFSHEPTAADVWLQLSAGPERPAGYANTAIFTEGLEFILVNDARKEAMLVRNTGGSSGSGFLVLPWIPLSTTFSHLSTTRAPGSNGLPQDDGWYAGARLVVVEWKAVGQYRTGAQWSAP